MTTISFSKARSDNDGGGGGYKEYPLIPESTVVEAEVVDVKYRPLNEEFRRKWNVNDTHEVSFHFKVLEEPFAGKHVWGAAKPKLNDSSKCRLRLWIQALLGIDSLPESYDLKADDDGLFNDFTGLRCRLMVEHKQVKKGTPDEYTRENVTQVIRSATPVEAEELYESF